PGPFGDDRRVNVERAELLAAEIWPCRKEIGEHLPVPVQTRAGTGTDAFLDRIVAVGVEAPALGKIDDADRRVAIGGDEDHSAHRLRPRGMVARQQAAVRVDAAEM